MIITLARVPFEGTVYENVKANHCAAINIDGTRLETQAKSFLDRGRPPTGVAWDWAKNKQKRNPHFFDGSKGRFPSNFIVSEGNCGTLDQQSGIIVSGVVKTSKKGYEGNSNTSFVRGVSNKNNQHGGVGGASRFFKVVK